MRLATAFRAFFAALAGGAAEQALREALDTNERRAGLPAPEPEAAKPAPRPAPKAAERSDAVALLATLQREARFVDLVKEPLEEFSDAQIGAAARPCLQQCAAAMERMFALEPLLAEPEGETVTLPADYSPLRFQVLGSSGREDQPMRIVHPGWKANRCQIPEWTGRAEDALVVTPAQVEAAQ